MASFSQNTFDGTDDEIFDQYFDQHFDQTMENLSINYGDQDEERRRKKKFILKEIVKKAMLGYGMIISVTLQRTRTIYSDEVLE